VLFKLDDVRGTGCCLYHRKCQVEDAQRLAKEDKHLIRLCLVLMCFFKCDFPGIKPHTRCLLVVRCSKTIWPTTQELNLLVNILIVQGDLGKEVITQAAFFLDGHTVKAHDLA